MGYDAVLSPLRCIVLSQRNGFLLVNINLSKDNEPDQWGLFGKGLIQSLWCSASSTGDLMLNTLSPHFHQASGSLLSARRSVSIEKKQWERLERSGRVSSSDLNVTGLIFCPWCHQICCWLLELDWVQKSLGYFWTKWGGSSRMYCEQF